MKKPPRPKSSKAQVEMLWEAMYNHVFTWMRWQDIKLNFVLVFLGLVVALLAITILT